MKVSFHNTPARKRTVLLTSDLFHLNSNARNTSTALKSLMKTVSSNTRSRSTARARSKSPAPPARFTSAPTRTFSRSVSPKRDSDPKETVHDSDSTDSKSTTLAERRNDVIATLNTTSGDSKEAKEQLKEKLEKYAGTPGVPLNDFLLDFGALSMDANVEKKFKVVLIGDGGVGKTSLVNRLKGAGFTDQYNCTNGADVSTLFFWTAQGKAYRLELWDCSGVEKMEGIGQGYYIGADGCLIMCDLLSNQSFKSLESRYQSFARVCGPGAPVVILGNKADVKDRKVKPKKTTVWPRKKNLAYYEISVKAGTNITAGFLHLVRTLAKDRSIEFVDRLAQHPPSLGRAVSISRKGAANAKEAALVALPQEDNDGL